MTMNEKSKTFFLSTNIYSKIPILVKSLLIVIPCLALGWFVIPHIIYMIIADQIQISPARSAFYELWLNAPVPIYFNVTIFNVTNPQEIENGMSPRFQEIGPYVFEEIRTKVNISFDEDQDTATYLQHVRYEFVQEKSGNKSLNDVITMLNVPFVAAAIKIEKDIPWPLSHFAHMILLNYKEPIFVEKTVHEALFHGWKVELFERIEEDTGLSFLENNTFSFFTGLNDTNKGPFTVMRASRGDKRLLGKVLKFESQSELPYWGDRNSSCNQFRGTDGFILAPFNTKDTALEAFNPDLCGSLYLRFQEEIKIEGIDAYKYTIPPSQMESPRDSLENRCFCPKLDWQPERCLGRGALNIAPCRDGAPVALSLPHFLDADPVYLQDIAGGVKPEREKHETFVIIEPISGFVIEAEKRFQISIILKQVPSIPALGKVKEMLFPCIWAEEGGRIDESNAAKLLSYGFLKNLAEYGGKICSVIGAVFIPTILFGLGKIKEETSAKNVQKVGDDSEECSPLT